MTDTRVLVVGVGSELRRDDGVGWVVARAIEKNPPEGVCVRMVTQLVPELVEAMLEVDLVVFIDAAVNSDKVTVQTVHASTERPTSHHGSPGSLIRLAELVGGPVPAAVLVSVPVSDLGLGTGLTSSCEGHVPEAASTVRRLAADVLESARATEGLQNGSRK